MPREIEPIEPERYELREHPRYTFSLNRRGFFGVAGTGLLIVSAESPAEAQQRGADGPVSARLQIGTDGRVTVFTGKVEVGQGSRTQITQAAAEELRVSPDRIDLVMCDTARTPDDGGTAGSATTPRTVPSVRRGAAAGREILLGLAAKRLGTGAAKLTVENGVIADPATGKRVSYAELAQDAAQALDRPVPGDAPLRPVEAWTVLGTSLVKPTSRDIVTGQHNYPADIQRPGMLYGKVLRSPTFGASLAALDPSTAKAIPGVTAVRDGDFAGCVAPTSFQAAKGVEAMAAAAQWNEKDHPAHSGNLFLHLKETATAGSREPRIYEAGSPAESMRGAFKRLEAAYRIPYIQHAPMEPRAAVAEWTEGRLTVWTGTQQPARVRSELARAFHIPESQVRLIVPDAGGAFGGKHTGETAVEAARLAKAAGKPVSLRWTREEEFTWAYFRPAGLMEVAAGIDRNGRLVAWEFTNYNSGASALRTPYEVPNRREQFRYSDSPLREGSYRVLAATANNFAREAFLDEVAALSGADPLEYRLRHLKEERMIAVLKAAAERFGWEKRRARKEPGTGIGIACGTEKGSFVAACVAVSVDRRRGNLKIEQICQAFECGAIQNPRNLLAQAEGCLIMTLGAVLKEEIRFEQGRILNAKFSQYPVPRFRDIPPVETVLVNRPDLPSVGAGETPMIAAPPAISNAIFDASGLRLRTLPFKSADLRSRA